MSSARSEMQSKVEITSQDHEFEGLTRLLHDVYGLSATAFVRLKTVLGILTTDGQRYVWKVLRSNEDAGRLPPIKQLVDRLDSIGIRAAGPIVGKNGTVLQWLPDGSAGYLQPWLIGRHVQLVNRQERLSAMATIGYMHQKLGHWMGMTGRPPGGSLTAKLVSKRATLEQIWPNVITLLPCLRSVEAGLFSHGDASVLAVQTAFPQRVFCHRDLAPHNLLWTTSDGRVSLIDFDRAGLDDPLVDVLQLLNHTLFLADVSATDLTEMTQAYERAGGKLERRHGLLWQLFRFPDLFVRASAEWAKTGFQPERKNRVMYAMERERLRWQLLKNIGIL